MKISELTIGQGNVDVEGAIISIGDVKTFQKFGKELRVCDAVLEDESGNVKLNLWNDDIDKFKVGDRIKISNGYVNEFQAEKQLTAGKFGKMEKVEDTSEEKEESEPEDTGKAEKKAKKPKKKKSKKKDIDEDY